MGHCLLVSLNFVLLSITESTVEAVSRDRYSFWRQGQRFLLPAEAFRIARLLNYIARALWLQHREVGEIFERSDSDRRLITLNPMNAHFRRNVIVSVVFVRHRVFRNLVH